MKANAKRFEKWDTSNLGKGKMDATDQKKDEKVTFKKDEKQGRKLEELFKIKINMVDPNTIDMEQLY